MLEVKVGKMPCTVVPTTQIKRGGNRKVRHKGRRKGWFGRRRATSPGGSRKSRDTKILLYKTYFLCFLQSKACFKEEAYNTEYIRSPRANRGGTKKKKERGRRRIVMITIRWQAGGGGGAGPSLASFVHSRVEPKMERMFSSSSNNSNAHCNCNDNVDLSSSTEERGTFFIATVKIERQDRGKGEGKFPTLGRVHSFFCRRLRAFPDLELDLKSRPTGPHRWTGSGPARREDGDRSNTGPAPSPEASRYVGRPAALPHTVYGVTGYP